MLKTRVITALVLLAGLLALLYFNSTPAFSVACTVFFAAACWETLRMFGNRRPAIGAAIWTTAFAATAYLFNSHGLETRTLFAICVAILVIRLIPSLAIGLPRLDSIGNSFLSGTYGIAVFGCFVAILALFGKHSSLYLFSVFAIVWIADTGAYFAGRAFGKHKLAPSISPGKSWEGAIGGWFAVMLAAAGTILAPALQDTFPVKLQAAWGWLGLLGATSALVAASIVGDLFESQLKRRAGMKDSSNLLPGHGGVLDRIDALIPALPLAVLLEYWI
jgi:phosphatidate cytidylyltransferase